MCGREEGNYAFLLEICQELDERDSKYWVGPIAGFDCSPPACYWVILFYYFVAPKVSNVSVLLMVSCLEFHLLNVIADSGDGFLGKLCS